jgi:hypothetical protein
MTTLIHTHTPHMEAISTTYGMGVDVQYTFCEECEQNIDRAYIYDDYDRLPYFTNWSVTK